METPLANRHDTIRPMPPIRHVPISPEWLTLRERVQVLLTVLPQPPLETPLQDQLIDTLAVAEAFKAVATQLLNATVTSGQTSQRFRAVVKALDFTTPKSDLQNFLQSTGV